MRNINGDVFCDRDPELISQSMEEESADYITSGRDHVCFIRSDGTVGCVGDNDNEQFLQMPLGVLW